MPLDQAIPVNDVKDLQPLIDRLSKARVVMLGESTHGTHEFYEWRRMISEWLVVKHGFRIIAVEGDWPPCQQLNRFVRSPLRGEVKDALLGFKRWPTWMWANSEVIRLAEWMQSHNSRLPETRMVGFHGLDVYSLFESIDEVLGRLEDLNPFLARRARKHYSCFDPAGRNEKSYARGLLRGLPGCEDEVVEILQELLQVRLDSRGSEAPGRERFDVFDLQQNGRVIRNAESYYRALVHADEMSWNVRDRHMLETLEHLLEVYGDRSKAIIWAHNTHVGDYRATDMARAGLVNLGGLAREKLGSDQVALVGFGTYEGSVVAAHAWDGPSQVFPVPPAQEGSVEALMHAAALGKGVSRLVWMLDPGGEDGFWSVIRGQRAIGVVYDPEHELRTHYVPTSLSRRYDAFFFCDRTRALEPRVQDFEPRQMPETWPTGA